MRKIVRSALIATTLGLVVVLVLLAATSVPRGKALDVYLLYLGAIALLALVAATSAEAGTDRSSEFDSALLRAQTPPARPRELERIEREVDLGQASVFYLHYRLRPTLREIAAHRLRTRRGLELDRRPSEARAALGEPAWDLLRADRVAPRFHEERGASLEEIRAVVERLEDV